VPAWGLDSAADPAGPAARALEALVAALPPHPGAWDVEARAEIPSRAGLGSSAALGVAVARALLAASGRPPLTDEAEAAATAAERVFHGNPSGIDVALAARGGLGVFRRDTGLVPLAARPIRLAIGLSGVPRDTAARVAEIAQRREEDPESVDARLSGLGELALLGRDALLARDRERLGQLFDRAQDILGWLGVSSALLERLCDLARRAGAYGAKLTGAGGGGAVIAVGRDDEVAAAWRAAGFEAQVVEVGAP
jgi:mevalonate kinase